VRTVAVRLDGLILVEPDVHPDSRGFFLETYRRSRYREVGIDVEFVQDNHSRSARGTVRALHFQTHPGQAKLIRVARGAIFDVVVDIRRSSPTFGQWESFLLTDDNHRQLYVPLGFAHGFCATSEIADVVYKVASYYVPETERGIAWNDPTIGVAWPELPHSISDRDSRLPAWRDVIETLPDW